jgi:thioredoxin reductase
VNVNLRDVLLVAAGVAGVAAGMMLGRAVL